MTKNIKSATDSLILINIEIVADNFMETIIQTILGFEIS